MFTEVQPVVFQAKVDELPEVIEVGLAVKYEMEQVWAWLTLTVTD